MNQTSTSEALTANNLITTVAYSKAPLTPKKKGKLKFLLGTVALVLVCGVLFTQYMPKAAATATTTYKESKVTRGDITAGISETGSVSIGYQTVKYDISSSKMEDLGLSVKVEEVYIKSGQKVTEGDPLIKISTDDLTEQLNDAKLSLKQAESALTQKKIDQNIQKIEAQAEYTNNSTLSTTAQSTYDLTITELENKITGYKNSASKLARQTKFLNSYLSDSDQTYFIEHLEENPTDMNFKGWDDPDYELPTEAEVKSRLREYQNSLATANVSLEKAELELEVQKTSSTGTMEANIYKSENAQELYDVALAQIDNDLASAELKVESAQKQVNQFTKYIAESGVITAPITGTIMSSGYNVGDDISSNTAIAVISNPQKASMAVSIVQEDVVALELGQTATISLDAFPNTVFTGALDSMSVSPARTGGSTVSYTVTASFDEPSNKFFEGMTGDITYISNQLKDVLIVANRAITGTDGVQTVKLKSGDSFEVREIVTGFSDGRNVEVTSGLQEGDIVLIESQVSVK